MQVMQRIAIYTGFTFFFTFATYFIVHNIMKYTLGNRVDSIEMDNNNIGYFILKGVMLILLTIAMLTLFDHFLSWFTPVVDTPFYH
jgi:multisubunit Na+/H+ antiporter MnhB subunit